MSDLDIQKLKREALETKDFSKLEKAYERLGRKLVILLTVTEITYEGCIFKNICSSLDKDFESVHNKKIYQIYRNKNGFFTSLIDKEYKILDIPSDLIEKLTVEEKKSWGIYMELRQNEPGLISNPVTYTSSEANSSFIGFNVSTESQPNE